MGNFTVATMFIIIVNLLMWFSTIAMQEVNPDGTMCYNREGTILANANLVNSNYSTVDNNVLSQLPDSANPSVVAGSSNPFTDIFNNMLSWFKSVPGVKYLYGVVAAPHNVIKCLDLPYEFAVGIETMWYLITLLILLAFLWWRDGG